MIKSIIWMGAERAIQLIISIAMAGLLLQFLGEENYSAWQYSFTIYSVLLALTWICGAEVLTPELIGISKEDSSRLIINYIQLKFMVSLCVAMIAIYIASIIDNSMASSFLIFTAGLIIFREPLMTGFSILQSQKKMDIYSKISIAAIFVKIVIMYGLMKAGGLEYTVALPWVVEGFIVSYLVFQFANINIKSIFSDFRILDALKLLKSGVNVWISLVLTIIYFKIDKIILKEVIDNSDYVRYAASSQLNENFLALSTMCLQIIFPYYLYGLDNAKIYRKKIIKTTIYYVVILVIISLIAAEMSSEISYLIFKKDILSEYFPLLIFMLPFFGVDGIANYYFYKNTNGQKNKILLIKSSIMFLSMASTYKITSYYLTPIQSQVVALYMGLIASIIFSSIYILKDLKMKLEKIKGE